MESNKRKSEDMFNEVCAKIQKLEDIMLKLVQTTNDLSQSITSNSNGAGTSFQNENVSTDLIKWEPISSRKQYNQKFKCHSVETSGILKLTLPDNETSLEDIINDLESAFARIIRSGLPNSVMPNDYIRVSLGNDNLDRDIYLPFTRASIFEPSMVTAEIMRVNQSKKEFLLNGKITITVMHVKLPSGGGRTGVNKEIDFDKWRTKAKCVIKIKSDGMCCARSIVIAKAHFDGVRGLEWEQLKDDVGNIQTEKANALCLEAGVLPFTSCGIEELQKFDSILWPQNYQLFVANSETKKSFLFIGTQADNPIFILYHDHHYDALTSIKAFLGRNYFCKKCAKAYNNIYDHKCIYNCDSCFEPGKCEEISVRSCRICHRVFKNSLCFEQHNLNKLCGKFSKCVKCSKTVRGKTHECFTRKCLSCKDKIIEGKVHDCFVLPTDQKKLSAQDKQLKIFVFYDFESCLMECKDGKQKHIPNLCIAQTVCNECWDSKSRTIKNIQCSTCKFGRVTFYGLNACNQFCIWMFSTLNSHAYNIQRERNLKYAINIIAFAHNAKAYDLQFVLKYLVNNNKNPDIVRNGSKLFRLKFGRYIFLDSVNFIPMPLKKLPKTFGFSDELKKGCFPYLFNTVDKINYKGKWPDKKFYNYQLLSPDEKKDFDFWYEKESKNEFDLERELKSYCEMDVDILSKCVMHFRDVWISITKLDPFTRCLTLPMAVMENFRAHYLKKGDISIVPYNGYEPERKASFMGSIWLDFISEKGNFILTREVKIGPYFADGFDYAKNEAYEFLGCVFHGCRKCFPVKRWHFKNPFNSKTMDELYLALKEKLVFYRSQNIKVYLKWECDFKNEINSNKELKNFYEKKRFALKSCSHLPPLNPRDAFFGGRVNALKLYKESSEEEEINYLDVISLYPFVLKYGRFPLGKPRIIKTFESNNIFNYNGLVFLKILPPKSIYIPILPYRSKGKLLFPLCRTCAENRLNEECKHVDEERCLVGTWVSDEIKVAISRGYQVVEIYEVWHFEKLAQQSTGEDGLFNKFMSDCLKIKIENSGWPKNNMTEAEKDKYIEENLLKQGIKLDKENIKFNPGLRQTGKIKVNAFWGKFGQNSNNRCSFLIRDPAEFFDLLANPSIIVKDAYLISEHVMLVQHEQRDEFIVDPSHSSIIIACYTTAL
ncbi:uncharacterized protein B4U79_10504, partial [Dinothrombium tinctorium]